MNPTGVSTRPLDRLTYPWVLPSFLTVLLVTWAAILLAGCVSPRITATSVPTQLAATGAPSAAPSPVIILPPSPTLSEPSSPSATYTSPVLVPTSPPYSPSPQGAPRLVVLARNLLNPDDLVLAPDHSIYFSDVGDGTVNRLDSSGKVTRIISNLQDPEGIVFLPDGSLVLAEQGKNRLMHFDLSSKQLTIFMELENKTGRPGVDGIVFDSRTLAIIVPDSPNGTVLRVGLDGKNVQVIARGMARPTGADIAPDGGIVVADEDGNSVRGVPVSGGPLRLLARLPVPDDVAVDAEGRIYVNTLGDGAIHLIDPKTGNEQTLWRGLGDPQGIIFDADGNLVITDPGNHRIVELILK